MRDKHGRELPTNRSHEIVGGKLQCMRCGKHYDKEAFFPSPNVVVDARLRRPIWDRMRWKPPQPGAHLGFLAAEWGMDVNELKMMIEKGLIVLESTFPCGKPHAVAFPSEVQSYCPRCK